MTWFQVCNGDMVSKVFQSRSFQSIEEHVLNTLLDSLQGGAPSDIKSWMKHVVRKIFGIDTHETTQSVPTQPPVVRRRLTVHINPASLNLDNKPTQTFSSANALAFDPTQSRIDTSTQARSEMKHMTHNARREERQGRGCDSHWNRSLRICEGTTQPFQKLSTS